MDVRPAASSTSSPSPAATSSAATSRHYDSDSLQTDTHSVVSTGGTPRGFTREDYGADLGGYLMRDKLWFFAAYDSVHHSLDSELPSGPSEGQIVTSKSRRPLGSAKLTFNVGPSVARRELPCRIRASTQRDQEKKSHSHGARHVHRQHDFAATYPCATRRLCLQVDRHWQGLY